MTSPSGRRRSQPTRQRTPSPLELAFSLMSSLLDFYLMTPCNSRQPPKQSKSVSRVRSIRAIHYAAVHECIRANVLNLDTTLHGAKIVTPLVPGKGGGTQTGNSHQAMPH